MPSWIGRDFNSQAYGVGPSFTGEGEWSTAGGVGNTRAMINQAMSRLLAPEEFAKLDQQTRSSFGSYMNYLNVYQRRKKNATLEADSYRQVKGGTFTPAPVASTGYSAAGASGGRRIPTAGGTAGGAIPTTIHRDMSGNPTEELAGQGITRDLMGAQIPQTAAQVGAQSTLDRSIPMAQMESDTEFLNKVSNFKMAQSNVALNKREEARLKLAQADRRIGQGDRRIDESVRQFDARQKQQRDLQIQREKHQTDLLHIRNDWSTGQKQLDADLRLNMNQLNNDVRKEMQTEAIKARIDLLNMAQRYATDASEKRYIEEEKQKLAQFDRDYQKTLEMTLIKNDASGTEGRKQLIIKLLENGQIDRDQAKSMATAWGLQ